MSLSSIPSHQILIFLTRVRFQATLINTDSNKSVLSERICLGNCRVSPTSNPNPSSAFSSASHPSSFPVVKKCLSFYLSS